MNVESEQVVSEQVEAGCEGVKQSVGASDEMTDLRVIGLLSPPEMTTNTSTRQFVPQTSNDYKPNISLITVRIDSANRRVSKSSQKES